MTAAKITLVNNHGEFTADPYMVEQAIAMLLPASVSDMRELFKDLGQGLLRCPLAHRMAGDIRIGMLRAYRDLHLQAAVEAGGPRGRAAKRKEG